MATGLPIPDPPVGIVAALADLSGAAVVAWDLGGRCIVWSAAAAALFGRPESAALGHPMRELIPLDDRSAVDECVVMTLAGESVPPHEKEFTDASGRRRYFRGRCRAVRDAGGAPLGGVSLIEEFTPVAAVERAFRESETLRRSIFDVSMDAKFVVDDAGSFTDCNPAAAALLGLPRDSILGLSIWSFNGASDEIRDEWARLRRVGAIHGLRRTTLPDGAILDLAYSAKAGGPAPLARRPPRPDRDPGDAPSP
jgi:PAS domain S-box-containing protein